jgi:hypothetical protein
MGRAYQSVADMPTPHFRIYIYTHVHMHICVYMHAHHHASGDLRLVISSAPSSSANVLCPMECGAQYLKPFLPLHTALVCRLALVPCQFKHVGCGAIMQRQSAAHHAAHDCAFSGAAAGLQELEEQVKTLHHKAAALSAAMDSLPSHADREREVLAHHQMLQLPSQLVAQAREGLQDKEWARLNWQQKLAVCDEYVEREGTHLVAQPPPRASAPPPPAAVVAPGAASKGRSEAGDVSNGDEVLGMGWTGNGGTRSNRPLALVCGATLKHAGGETAAVCAVAETRSRTVLLASASGSDRALRFWKMSDCGRNAEHLHTAAASPAPIVALHSSAQVGGKVFAGGAFPADIIQVLPLALPLMRVRATLA